MDCWKLARSSLSAHAISQSGRIMRCHFVFTVKRNSDGSVEKFKARLVADGNTQKWGIDFDKVFSTVAKLSTLRLVLILAAAHDYNLSSVDIRQAYLQATLAEELYMMVPQGLPDRDDEGYQLVTRLKRSLYGLKQAGRESVSGISYFPLLSRSGASPSRVLTLVCSLTAVVTPCCGWLSGSTIVSLSIMIRPSETNLYGISVRDTRQ